MMEIKTIEEAGKTDFDNEVNNLLSEGFRILSTNAGNEYFSAILLRETVHVGKETCNLTLPKDEMISLLYIMCLGCKAEGCDFCIFMNLFQAEFEKNCPFQDDPHAGEGSLYFDMAVSRGLIKVGSQ